MAQPYVGEIRMFAGNFAPAGWMFCEGQLLPISEYETLFNLIGTTYGGDGQSTFALPICAAACRCISATDSHWPKQVASKKSRSRRHKFRHTATPSLPRQRAATRPVPAATCRRRHSA